MSTFLRHIVKTCTLLTLFSTNALAAGPCLWGANSLANCLPTAGLLLDNQRDLRLGDTAGGEYVALEAPGTIGSSYTLTFPNAAPAVTGYALTGATSGALSWSPVMTNPMTTVNDVIYGGASGTPTRLGIGANNTVFTSTGAVTAPAWSLLVNANIDAAAAIDVTKLAPQGAVGYVLASTASSSAWTNAFETTVQSNILGNGAFNLWQIATTFTVAGAGNVVSDRWFARRGTSAAGLTVSQQPAPDAVGFAARVQRDSGNSSTEVCWIGQIMPDSSSTPFRGRNLTVRFKYRTGANFSGANLSVRVYSTTNSNSGMTSTGIPTNATDLLNTTVATNTSYSTQTLVTTTPVGSTANQIGVSFIYTPTGSAGANDWFEVAEVMLVPGSFASLPYIAKGGSMSDDAYFTRQFVEKSYSEATAPATSTSTGLNVITVRATNATTTDAAMISYKVPKFAATTSPILYSQTGVINNWAFNGSQVVATVLFANQNSFTVGMAGTASGLTAGNAVTLAGHWLVISDVY